MEIIKRVYKIENINYFYPLNEELVELAFYLISYSLLSVKDFLTIASEQELVSGIITTIHQRIYSEIPLDNILYISEKLLAIPQLKGFGSMMLNLVTFLRS